MAGDDATMAADASQKEDALTRSVREIRSLEDQLIALKQRLLMDSAGGGTALSSDLSFLLLRTGGQPLAAPLLHVEEVVEMPELIPLPRPVPAIAGLVNYHAEIIAVIRLDELTGAPDVLPAISQVLVVCRAEGRLFALKADEALEVVTVRPEDITMTDRVLPGILRTSGMLRMDSTRTVLIIDPVWISAGLHLGAALQADAATPQP